MKAVWTTFGCWAAAAAPIAGFGAFKELFPASVPLVIPVIRSSVPCAPVGGGVISIECWPDDESTGMFRVLPGASGTPANEILVDGGSARRLISEGCGFIYSTKSMVDATGSWGVEFGRDGPFMLVPKERGRSTNNQHFCHRAEIGFFSRKIIKMWPGGKKENDEKDESLEVSGRLREKKGSLCGEGGRKCVDNRICRSEFYKIIYGVWSTGMKEKDMDITYIWICYVCGKRGHRAIYFNCLTFRLSLPYWLGFCQFNYQLSYCNI